MATRDYVKRGGKPRNTRRVSTKKPKKRAYSIRITLFAAIALVISFASGLAYLSMNSPTPTQTSPSISTPALVDKKPYIPPAPEAKWTYIKELEKKEVEVTINEQKTSTRPYLMQCGAYRSSAQAEERKAMIAFQGLDSNIRVSPGETGNWYRIVLGPYDLKRDAERDRNILRRGGVEPCAIWYWE